MVSNKQRIRNDGRYIDIGENDNVTVRKVSLSKDAIGILGYDYFAQNTDILFDIAINGSKIKTTTTNNLDEHNFNYPLLRPIFLVTSKKNIIKNQYIKLFLLHILSNKANTENGYLSEINLIPLREKEMEENRKKIY